MQADLCAIRFKMSDSLQVFNRRIVRRHRDRAAARLSEHDFLFVESADRLVNRLGDVTRIFPLALDLGCHGGELARALAGTGKVATLVKADLSPAMAARAKPLATAADEELLPFADGVFDLVVSNLNLHWVNDLPGALAQILRTLKPDGLFLAAVLAGKTLIELRHALSEAEIIEESGLSPRVSPFADVCELGGLLVRVGFALPVADADNLTVSYDDPMKLMTDLRGMGESNAVELRRPGFTRRSTMAAAAEIYCRQFGDDDGRVRATFQIVTLTAWAPDPSQQKPLKPGNAWTRLADALDTDEIPAGDKAKP